MHISIDSVGRVAVVVVGGAGGGPAPPPRRSTPALRAKGRPVRAQANEGAGSSQCRWMVARGARGHVHSGQPQELHGGARCVDLPAGALLGTGLAFSLSMTKHLLV